MRGRPYDPAMELRLRPLRTEDEAAFITAHRAMSDEGFAFGLFYDDDREWTAFLDALDRQHRAIDIPPDRVAATFLVAEVGTAIVGRTSIRHELNDFLANEGGHIGYGVLREHRRRGYATEILRQSLIVARAEGVDRVLVTCDDDNVGSATVIERCGGVLDSRGEASDGTRIRRYWIH
jgi:predicted acetyltransferase